MSIKKVLMYALMAIGLLFVILFLIGFFTL